MAGVPVTLPSVLANLAGTVSLISTVEGVAVPLIVGLVKEIKAMAEGQVITYTVAIQTGEQNLQQADTNFTTALTEINAELAKTGHPPLDIPGPVTSAPAASTTPTTVAQRTSGRTGRK